MAHALPRLTLTTEAGTRAADFYRRCGWTESSMTAEGELVFELKLPS